MEPKVIDFIDVVHAEFGTIVWLEYIYKGHSYIEAYLVDIEMTQKPVICNAREMIYNISPEGLYQGVKNSFANPEIKQFRFWLGKPSKEQREARRW